MPEKKAKSKQNQETVGDSERGKERQSEEKREGGVPRETT